MRATTLVRYLLGDLEAARTVASDPWRTIGVGLLLVTGAMIAREHDGAYLPAKPIHAALPFVAGLGGALASGSLLYAISRLRGGTSPGLVVMLTRWTALFLWTAPLAWLYGIPFERVFDEQDAAVLQHAGARPRRDVARDALDPHRRDALRSRARAARG